MADAAAMQNPATLRPQTAYGLRIASAFALPGAAWQDEASADLTIVSGPAVLAGAAEVHGPYRRAGNRLELTIPAAGRFLLAGPGRLEVAPEPDFDPAVLGAFLIASGVPMLLWQRGGVLLHATGLGLSEGGPALALAGPSGVGKSTLARLLLDRGARLIGDDTLWLPRPADGMAYGLSGGQFLRDAASSEPVFHPLPPEQRSGPARLGALVMLARGGTPGPPERLGQLTALQAVLHTRHRPRVPALLGRDGAVLADCSALVAAVPVFRLTVPEGDPAAAAAAVAELAEGLRT